MGRKRAIYTDNYYQIRMVVWNPISCKGELKSVPVLASSYPEAAKIGRAVSYWWLESFLQFKESFGYLFRQEILRNWIYKYHVEKWQVIRAFSEAILRLFRFETLDLDTHSIALKLLVETKAIIDIRYKAN